MAPENFGTTSAGEPVSVRTLTNGPLAVRVMDYGATLTSVVAPDARGVRSEITLGHDNASGYVSGPSVYFGCVAGRVANRIAGGRFVLDGREHSLATNNGKNALHGGVVGFDKRMWKWDGPGPHGDAARRCMAICNMLRVSEQS